MFRLVALKVLDDCATCAHKILQSGTLYRFCQDYDNDPDNEYTLKKVRAISDTERTLYDAGQSNVEITVKAFVGKNGDGKSSIVELIIRVLNNFAICYGYKFDQDSLCYNVSVSAILYYEIDGHIYSIYCPVGHNEKSEDKGYRVKWYKDGNSITDTIPLNDESGVQRKLWLKENHADELFYSLVINYSIYSYNSRLLGEENENSDSWIDALFHKNDSYQTPIVLNPMRTDGNIDINREESLSHQRLMAIYTMAGSDSSQRMIGDDKEAIGYAFSLEKESKLLTNTISGYFKRIHQRDFPWPQLEHYIERKDSLNNKDDEALYNICSHFVDFWEDFQMLSDFVIF